MLKEKLNSVVQDKIGSETGLGRGKITFFLEGSELPKNAGLIAHIELEPGATVGYHKHIGEGELYYIISGHGEYQEDGKAAPISEGMTTMVYDGQSHGLINSADAPMKLLAIIIKD